jgi:N-acetylmuramoyl-L-alanine amidase/FG-GAP-like repeat
MANRNQRPAGWRRTALTLSVLPVLIPGLVMVPSIEAAPSPRPVLPRIQTIALTSPATDTSLRSDAAEAPAEASRGSHRKVRTAPIETDPYQLVAATWSGATADLTVTVRHRASGRWSPWHTLPAGDGHGPDPGSREADGTRLGTDPLVVPESDAVEARVDVVDGVLPADLRLDLIDPGHSPADGSVGVASGDAAVAAPTRPTIFTRAQWGADESVREPGLPSYGDVRGAFVHHTVNANSYSAADVPAIIRGIYAYHVNSRGWRDIGYNFLVDKFGRVWEGRFGGIDRPVTGAHTAGYNDDAFAMSAIGTYTSQPPEAALISAYQRLFSWKFSIHGVDPRRVVNYDGEIWPAIAGHRDAASTECPGTALYRQLPSIRAGTVAAMSVAPALSLGRDVTNDGYPDLLARRQADGSLWVWRGAATGGFGQLTEIGAGWQTADQVILPGDLDGDGADDVVARRPNGELWLYRGDGSGGLLRATQIGVGWQGFATLLGPGDIDGDLIVDLLGQAPDGVLWLYRGDGAGGVRPGVEIGFGWNAMSAVVAPGDWDGDGRVDLMGRRALDGSLWLYAGVGNGGFGRAVQVGSHWNRLNTIIGGGDVNHDGPADLIARTADGRMLLYPGNGQGYFRPTSQIGHGWNVFDLVV